jgi:hypothetical protein
MVKQCTRIYQWTPPFDRALSADSKSLWLSSPSRLVACMGASLPASNVTLLAPLPTSGRGHFRLRSLRVDERHARDHRKSAPSAAWKNRVRNSARTETASTALCSIRPARFARRQQHSSGSATTRSGPIRTESAGIWRATTASRRRTTNSCASNRAAFAQSAVTTNPTRMAARAGSSASPWTTATPRAAFAACSAKSATGRSAY